MARLSAVQLTSSPDVDKNLMAIEDALSSLPQNQNHLVVLPECCLYFGGKDSDQLTLAQDEGRSRYIELSLAEMARSHNAYLVAGTVPTNVEGQDKFYNQSRLYSPEGECLTRYNKLHLFDVEVNDNERNYQESKYTEPGKSLKFEHIGFAKLGMSVCYDLRFPELFRRLRQAGSDIISVPAAFTKVTGQAHWQPLLQARAIENQCYIVAAGQVGVHENGRETWGHSMIISPWGEILTELPDETGVITTTYEPSIITETRKSIPVEKHNQFIVEQKPS